ncbi:MAG TPA: sugar ABC transporter permease [Anaerolinea sp.]|nr:sugar ABC transporter permease [Anaerolinea sp.]
MQTQSTRPKLPSQLKFFRRLSFEETLWGWLLILPAVLGLILFKFGPVIASLYFSFTKYDILSAPKWIGLENYKKLTLDAYWIKSIQVTLNYSVLFIPLSLLVAYVIALLMSQDLKGISVYRTMWYLPSLVPTVASAVVWRWALNPEFGPVNFPLRMLGLDAPGWLTDPRWIIPSVVLIQLWGLGNAALIFLAAIKGVPDTYYEAAEVDGASNWTKFWKITLPMTSSVIFFQMIMAVIGSFQVFGVAYILFSGQTTSDPAGPGNSALFYVLYTYRNAFGYFKNGYASAMAWIMFVVIMILTFILFRTQKMWVYYEVEGEK